MSELKGRIHSFDSFGTVDGPGIRFIVFMQGCPLKCKFCHNRDTWDFDKGKEYTVEEIVKKLKRVKPYIDASSLGGGITVSGGEPLGQAEFVLELFKECKKQGFHTCLDTAGSYKLNDTIKQLLEYTDLVLLDIKHIDSNKCKDLTGMDNTNNKNFAKYLSQIHKKVWIRQVLVPGITDDEEDLKKTQDFILELGDIVEKIDILPYHDMGKFKWIETQGSYPLEGVRVATSDDVEKAKKILHLKEV